MTSEIDLKMCDSARLFTFPCLNLLKSRHAPLKRIKT